MSTDRNDAPRLPKQVEADPQAARVAASLAARRRTLWSGGQLPTPVVGMTARLAATVQSAQMSRRLTRGLERAEKKLAAESRGLDRVDRRAGIERGQRVSRLMLVANDGAERMYRRIESLLRQYGDRLLVVQLTCDALELGALLGKSGSPTKVVMLDHKDAVTDALLSLAGSAPRSSSPASARPSRRRPS